jgi:hypothetical protein
VKERMKAGPAAYAALVVILAGAILGFTVSYWFLLLVPIGVFLPGILRRTGVLRDVDEYVLMAQDAAGWMAFCAVVCCVILFFICGRVGLPLGGTETDRLLVTAIVGLTVYASGYLFRFWDGRRGAFWLLVACGAAWGVFVVLSGWNNPAAMAMEGLVIVVPMFVLAVLGRFIPRIAGVAALAAAAALTVFFHAWFLSRGPSLFVLAAIVLPLVVAGIGLLTKRRRDPS